VDIDDRHPEKTKHEDQEKEPDEEANEERRRQSLRLVSIPIGL